MFRFIFYTITFIFFISPASLYLLFKKEPLNKTTKLLKIIFILKFIIIDLILYIAIFLTPTTEDDRFVKYIILFIIFVFNFVAILIYNIYFSDPISIEKLPTETFPKENINEEAETYQELNEVKNNEDNSQKIFNDSFNSTNEEENSYTLPELIKILEDEYVDTGKILNFEYQGTRDKIPLNREVIIRRVYEKNDIFYMDAIDIDSKRPKMFRLDRIISIEF